MAIAIPMRAPWLNEQCSKPSLSYHLLVSSKLLYIYTYKSVQQSALAVGSPDKATKASGIHNMRIWF